MRIAKVAAATLAAAFCAVAAAGCAGQAAATGASAAAGAGQADSARVTGGDAGTDALATCTTAQLKITLTRTGAVAGQAGGYLRFTNDSHVSCRLSGWPVVSGVTAAGQVTAFRHARSTMFGAWQYSAPVPVLTLRPGNSGYAVVEADDLPVGTQTNCPPPDVRLRVAAPGGKAGVLISGWLPGDRTYLPTCRSGYGSGTSQISTISTLAQLPH